MQDLKALVFSLISLHFKVCSANLYPGDGSLMTHVSFRSNQFEGLFYVSRMLQSEAWRTGRLFGCVPAFYKGCGRKKHMYELKRLLANETGCLMVVLLLRSMPIINEVQDQNTMRAFTCRSRQDCGFASPRLPAPFPA